MRTIAIVVDIRNLFKSLKRKYDRKLDFRKYYEFCSKNKQNSEEDAVLVAHAFGITQTDIPKTFITCLRHIGYQVQYKKIYDYKDSKNNIYIETTLSVVSVLDKVERVVLGSSDPAFIPLIQHIQSRGATCHVVACKIPNVIRDLTTFDEIDESLLEEEKIEVDGVS